MLLEEECVYCRTVASKKMSGSWQHEDGIADPNAVVTALAGSYSLQRRYTRFRVLASGL